MFTTRQTWLTTKKKTFKKTNVKLYPDILLAVLFKLPTCFVTCFTTSSTLPKTNNSLVNIATLNKTNFCTITNLFLQWLAQIVFPYLSPQFFPKTGSRQQLISHLIVSMQSKSLSSRKHKQVSKMQTKLAVIEIITLSPQNCFSWICPNLKSLSRSDSRCLSWPGSLRANILITSGVLKASLIAACVACTKNKGRYFDERNLGTRQWGYLQVASALIGQLMSYSQTSFWTVFH